MISALSIRDVHKLSQADVFDLDSLYSKAILSKKNDDSRQGVFHPSAVGGCRRASVYEYIRAPFLEDPDEESQEIFELGHHIHDIIQSRLEHSTTIPGITNLNVEFTREVSYDAETDLLHRDMGIGGTTDGILRVWTPEWEQRGVLEAKSIATDGFDRLKGPDKKHLMQAHLYCYRYDLPVMWIFYYNKNNSKRQIYSRVFDPKIFDEAVEYFAGLMDHVQLGTLPPRDESFYICPRCKYRDLCKPNVLGMVKAKQANNALTSIRKNGNLGRKP